MPGVIGPPIYRGRRVRPLLLWAGLLSAGTGLAQAPACHVLTEEHGLWALPGCEVVEGRLRLSADTLAQLPYDVHGLAAISAADSFHYVTRDGRTQAVITWDNGPDYLQEGLLRGRIGDRIGYFNAHLEPAFSATFDFGWPFSDGVAQVCNGCRRGATGQDGHTPMEGGEWFHIDRRGHRVADPAGP